MEDPGNAGNLAGREVSGIAEESCWEAGSLKVSQTCKTKSLGLKDLNTNF